MNDISGPDRKIQPPNDPTFQRACQTQHSPMNESVSGDGEQLATFHIVEASRALTAFTAPAAAFAVPVKGEWSACTRGSLGMTRTEVAEKAEEDGLTVHTE